MTKLKSKKLKQANLKKSFRRYHARIAWLLVVLLAILLWWKPMTRLFDDLTGKKTSNNVAATPSALSSTGQVATVPSTAGTTSNTSTTRSTESTTTDGTTTVPTTGGGGTTTTGGGDDTGDSSTTATVTSPVLYTKVDTGQTLPAIVNLAGGQPNSCTPVISVPLVGTQQVCTWLNNGKGVAVTLVNGTVASKAQLGF